MWTTAALAQETAQATAPEAAPAVTAIASETPTPCPRKTRCVVIADAFAEMHSGPGRGYPVVHVAERGEQIEVLTRRTDWFYVRSPGQWEGWVHRDQMLTTLELNGELVDLKEPTRNDYATRRWEGGAFIGRFEGASLVGIYGGYGLSDHLTLELSLANAVGNVRDSYIATLGINHAFAPEWLITPYAGLGTGVINIQPRSTLVQPTDRTDQLGYVDIGARGYIGRRFLARFEYRGNVVFTSRNKNEEIHEWKLGFSFFF